MCGDSKTVRRRATRKRQQQQRKGEGGKEGRKEGRKQEGGEEGGEEETPEVESTNSIGQKKEIALPAADEGGRTARQHRSAGGHHAVLAQTGAPSFEEVTNTNYLWLALLYGELD